MKNGQRILILYHSGSGSTKTIAEIYHEQLKKYTPEICPIGLDYDYCKMQDYAFFIFAFPTYHCSPSTSMLSFIRSMPVFSKPKKAFAFTTCGLYSGNALREFIKACAAKNIMVNGNSAYRGPASDGALLLPPIPFMFRYERKIAQKVKLDIQRIEDLIRSGTCKIACPPFKLYEILNYPNKMAGKVIKHTLSVIKNFCVKCNKCIDNCIRKCWVTSDGYPKHEGENCEFCFKCVHHCPKEAIILSNKIRKRPKLNESFYRGLKDGILQQMRDTH